MKMIELQNYLKVNASVELNNRLHKNYTQNMMSIDYKISIQIN